MVQSDVGHSEAEHSRVEETATAQEPILLEAVLAAQDLAGTPPEVPAGH